MQGLSERVLLRTEPDPSSCIDEADVENDVCESTLQVTTSSSLFSRPVLAALAMGILLGLVAIACRWPASKPVGLGGIMSGAEEELNTDLIETCTSGRANCIETKCCGEPGLQCYKQDDKYAQCRPSCTPGPDPTHWDSTAWTCDKLGVRTAGEDQCGEPGQDCRTSKCCKDTGFQCYEKNSSWATCKAECVADGPDLSDKDNFPWSCKELGERSPQTAPWVWEECAAGWDNCLTTRCCKNAGEQCYKQNDFFGECQATGCLTPGWACEPVGYRTPPAPAKGAMISPWVLDKCSKLNEGCLDTKCCIGMDVQCYAKNEEWAQCKETCTPGNHLSDNNETWWCKPLGPRSYGLSTKGFPSLYCFSVFRTVGYEPALIKAQHDRGVGIFACDDFDLLTADTSTYIAGVKTIQFQGAPIVKSIDNTAGNTELFVHAWHAVIGSGKWINHAFILKVDPDAVFIPERARWHLKSHVGEKIFVINCHQGDMIYGALEIFSHAAIKDWVNKGKDCPAPNNYGEDKYMTTCMDKLGVARVHDESVLGDKLCGTFSGCNNGWNPAFHPFKDTASWMACLNEALGNKPPML